MTQALRVPVTILNRGRLRLEADAARYVVRVHRLGMGDELCLFEPASGQEAVAKLTAVTPFVECEVGEPAPGTRRGFENLHLVHALAKADKPERVLRDATALGVGCISWVESERSVSKLGARVHLKQRRLAEVALQAARQCLRSDVPVITLARSFEAALSDACGPGTIVLQPARGALLSTALSEFDAQKINLWIGPEGGFSEREQGELRSRGAIFANLGSLVLRTELAATVALAIATDHLRRR